MRLTAKIFIAASLPIVVLATVSAMSVRAVNRLVAAHREITSHSLPAVRTLSSAKEGIGRLGRLEARFAILRDSRYATLRSETAAGIDKDLARLGGIVQTSEERSLLDVATAAFTQYRRLVKAERELLVRGDRESALDPTDSEGQAILDRVGAALERLDEATEASVRAAGASAMRLERRTGKGVIIALGSAVVLALGCTAFVSVRLTRSVRRLSEATARVATGAFDQPIGVRGMDEISELARSFNLMAADLRQIDRLKEDFFAAISHDLRSPLTSVAEAAKLLEEEVAGPLTPQQQRLVTIIGASCQRLLALVRRILELSALRAGVLPLERDRVDVERVVACAVEELRPRASGAGVVLHVERSGKSFTLIGDEMRLVQVVVNLVENALRFTPKGGQVTVRLIDATGSIEIQVEDTGVGIPAAALPSIFEPYRRAHHNRQGSGLGLAIVRGVIEAHCGAVTAESREGQGSRFTVRLPQAQRAA